MFGLGISTFSFVAGWGAGAGAVRHATGLLTGGDSLMAGASGVSLWKTLDAASGLSVSNIAVGGNSITEVRSEFTELANRDLLAYPVIIWDGSPNGYDALEGDKTIAYVDLIAEAIAEVRHDRWLVVPPINPYDSTYAGSIPEAIWLEMQSRWPGQVFHWSNGLSHDAFSIAADQFVDPPSDAFHLSQLGADNMSAALLAELRARDWIGSQRFHPADLDGLVALYLPNADTSSIPDLSGSGNDLTAVNSATYSEAEGFPTLVFDGSNNYYTGGPTAGAARTIGVALKKSTSVGFIYGSVAATDTRSNISVDASGTRINVGANTPAIRIGINNSNWQSFVATHDGAEVKALSAGSVGSDTSAVSTAVQSGVTTPSVESYLGNFNNNGSVYTSNYFSGHLAALVEYNRALTNDEMRSVRSWLRRTYNYET